MRGALQTVWEIILAITGTLALGALTVAGLVALFGCGVFGVCWAGLGWHKRRRARRGATAPEQSKKRS